MKSSIITTASALLLAAALQTYGAMPNALVQYSFEDGSQGDSVTTIANNAALSENPLTVYAGDGVTLSQSATPLLGLAGFYNGAVSTEMTDKGVLNLGAQVPFAVSGWINPLASEKNQVIGGNRYNSAGWSIELTRCNSTTGNNTLQILYGKSGPKVTYDLSDIDDVGSELGWNFFVYEGSTNAESGAFEINLFIGDLDGNLVLVDTVDGSTGSGDVSSDTSHSGFGANMLRASSYPATSWNVVSGYMDEMSIWDDAMSFTLDTDGMTVIGGDVYTYYKGMVPVPESAATAALLGFAALALAVRRRR